MAPARRCHGFSWRWWKRTSRRTARSPCRRRCTDILARSGSWPADSALVTPALACLSRSRIMSAEVKIPAVGESITSGLLSTWHKQDGDTVAAGDALLTLETDKVATEVTAP